tara:strand:- start:319 stop:507 length:189 start_codon:yes stop_codon:yes gene_type:complete
VAVLAEWRQAVKEDLEALEMKAAQQLVEKEILPQQVPHKEMMEVAESQAKVAEAEAVLLKLV